jgi:hypothetical protein
MQTAALPAFLALAVLGPQAVLAAQCVEQIQSDGSDQNQVIHSTRTVAQTFTAGRSGYLAGLEVSLWEMGLGAADDLTLEILDASGGDLSVAPVLGTVTADEGDLGPNPLKLKKPVVTATYFSLSGLGILLQPGDEVAFRFSTTRVLPNRYLLRIALADLYDGGDYFVDDAVADYADAAFKTFFSQPGGAGYYFGSGVNPIVLHPGPAAPTIGAFFEPFLSGPLTPFDLAYVLVLGKPGPDLPFGAYEILMDLPAVASKPAVIGLNPVKMPSSCSLVGVHMRMQVYAKIGGPAPGYALSNALDLTIGN